MKPVLAFTMGDPAGIGPEIVLAAARDPRVRAVCEPLLVGSRRVFESSGRVRAPIVDPGAECFRRAGRPEAAGAAASFAAVRLALSLARRKLVTAVVTAPISKEGWKSAGINYPDHTEYFQKETGTREAAMLLAAGPVRTVLVTRHMPLKDVAGRLRVSEIISSAKLLRAGLKFGFGIARPKIALCGFNPHAGEGGLLGAEERLLAQAARRAGLPEPMAADSVWAAHAEGKTDAVISIYHDQALIPLKLISRYGVVNWTLGIPLIRTSPGHGTAFDIAGKGRARPDAEIEAALLAARLARKQPVWV